MLLNHVIHRYSNRTVTQYTPAIAQHEVVKCNQPLHNCSAPYEDQLVCICTCIKQM